MKWPWSQPEPPPTEQPHPDEARRELERLRAQRPEIERKAARLRWHLQENDFRRNALLLLKGEDR